MNDRPHRVVGVLPNVPHYPQENDVYMPVLACPFRANGERQIARNRRAFGALSVFGRVKEGIALEQAKINPADVQILNMRPPEVRAAWQRGDIQATFIWNPVLAESL